MSAFAGPVAIVTGSSGDIGQAVLAALRASGALVVAADLGLPEWQQEEADLVTVRCNVTSETDVAALIDRVVSSYGRVDVVVTCAGIEGPIARLEDYEVDDFRRVLDVNLVGTFLMIKHVLPAMRQKGSGSIVTIASTAGRRGSPLLSGYVASKHAVIGLTRAAAAETASDGIRVNAVCPGPTTGRMISAIDQGMGRELGQPADRSATRTPTGRYALPSEVASMVAHLALAAPFVTGSVVMVDGGRTAV